MHKFVSNYERACEITETFAKWLRGKVSYPVLVTYNLSLLQVCRESELSEPLISLKGLPFRNNGVSFCAFLVEQTKPFWLNLWKYGDKRTQSELHLWKEFDLSSLSCDLFPWAFSEMEKFFGLPLAKGSRFVQLSLFDF